VRNGFVFSGCVWTACLVASGDHLQAVARRLTPRMGSFLGGRRKARIGGAFFKRSSSYSAVHTAFISRVLY